MIILHKKFYHNQYNIYFQALLEFFYWCYHKNHQLCFFESNLHVSIKGIGKLHGRDVLQAYIPSLGRGHNILKSINEIDQSIIFDIEETDSEILFKFKYADSDKIIPLLKPKTSGANISPFSSRNLPKNKTFKIPDEQLEAYQEIVSKIPQERILTLTHRTNSFIKSLATKRNPIENIKADMKLKGLRGKEYIYSIGEWDNYIKFLKENI